MPHELVPSDLAQFDGPRVAVDLVLMTICGGALCVLMMERSAEPYAGRLVLPGGFVHAGERVEDTARRVLAQKVGLEGLAAEQLYTFSEPHRDPRIWVVSVAHLALMPCAELTSAVAGKPGLRLAAVVPHEADGEARLEVEGEKVWAGFDHAEIIAVAVQRLRGKLDWSMVAFELLPPEFTLFELQHVHEVILGRRVNKPHFRKKMLGLTFADGRQLVATGTFSRAGRHRPAELYRLGPSERTGEGRNT